MSDRLPALRPEELSPDQRDLYDVIAGGPRAGGALFALIDADGALNGPFNAMLYAPGVGQALQELGATLRYRSSLSARVREAAILAVAAHWDSAFERYAHEPIARDCGLTDAAISALRSGVYVSFEDPSEQLAYDTVHALLTARDLDDAAYTAARDGLGETALVELSTLVGYYSALALQLRLFRVGIPS